MSDKLFKNDLTPSTCQSPRNSGQIVACAAISPSSHALHNSMTPSLGVKPLTEGMFQAMILLVNPWVSHSSAAPTMSGMLGEKAAPSVPRMRSAHCLWHAKRQVCTGLRLGALPGTSQGLVTTGKSRCKNTQGFT